MKDWIVMVTHCDKTYSYVFNAEELAKKWFDAQFPLIRDTTVTMGLSERHTDNFQIVHKAEYKEPENDQKHTNTN